MTQYCRNTNLPDGDRMSGIPDPLNTIPERVKFNECKLIIANCNKCKLESEFDPKMFAHLGQRITDKKSPKKVWRCLSCDSGAANPSTLIDSQDKSLKNYYRYQYQRRGTLYTMG